MYFRFVIGILAQIGSSISFGISNALWKIPMQTVGHIATIFLRTIFSVLFLGAALLIFKVDIPIAQIEYVGYAILLSAMSFFGLYFFTKAMKIGSASVTSVAASSAFIVGQLTAVFLLGETIKPFHYISLILFLISIVVLEEKKFKLQLSREVGYALLAALFWGTTLTLMAIPAKEIGFIPCSFITESTVLLISGIILFQKRNRIWSLKLEPKSKYSIVLMGLFSALGVSFMYLAFSLEDAYVVVALSAITHNIAVIASRIILKEPIKGNLVLSSLLSTIAIISIVF